MSDTLPVTVPAHIEVDPAPSTGEVLLIAFCNDDLDSTVMRMTPGTAARLAHRLLRAADVAWKAVEP